MKGKLPDNRDIVFLSGYAIANYIDETPPDTGWIHQVVEFVIEEPKWYTIKNDDIVPSVSLSAIYNGRKDEAPMVGWAVDSCTADVINNMIRLTCPLSLIAEWTGLEPGIEDLLGGPPFSTGELAGILRLDYCVTAIGRLYRRKQQFLHLDKSIMQRLVQCANNLWPVTIADSSPTDGIHVAGKAIDGSLDPESRWSSQGIGAHITVDLGKETLICRVEIAWYKGNERTYHFVISTSDAYGGFTQKFTGDSSNLTLSPEKYYIPLTNTRYVKITVNGNTDPDDGEWAAITEIAVYGP